MVEGVRLSLKGDDILSNYVVYHLHDDTSNCNGFADSCTSYKEYIDMAKKCDMKAIAFSNHGGIYDWIKKKQDCDKAGIKYIHGTELYLCTSLAANERGYHIGLYAKNEDGVKELNSLISLATSKGKESDNSDRHFYYNPRISIEELKNTSSNIIVTSACLASVLWQMNVQILKLKEDEDIAEEEKNIEIEIKENLIKDLLTWMGENNDRCFLEIQYHKCQHQVIFNKLLCKYSQEYNIPLIAGTDTHSSTPYKAECRKILQKSKDSYYDEEDEFDLTWKTYDEIVESFRQQNAIPEEAFMEAIENTNRFADMIEDFKLDYTFKYPDLYGKEARDLWRKEILRKFNAKLKKNIIDSARVEEYKARIKEEFEAMTKQNMESFMLFMSELVDYCQQDDIPYGFCRGSVGGSAVAYITDITDVDPIRWNTVFSRFCNADRISLADIDIDFSSEDREKVYKYIINRFTPKKTAYIAQFGTLKDKGTIDVLAKGLGYENLDEVKIVKKRYEELFGDYMRIVQEEVNLEELEDIDAKKVDFDYCDTYMRQINNPYAREKIKEIINKFEDLKKENKSLFYYFDGLKGTIVSKGSHPAGIIGSPITLADNLGVFYKGGDENMPVSVCAMKSCDSINLVKFDILGLKTVGILKDFYKYIGSEYQKSHQIDWNDEKVWENMGLSNVGCFQFEGSYAFRLLKDFEPRQINDMSLVNAALRPSGKSYRDGLIKREPHSNPSTEIDDLLRDNYGRLVYQEDTIKFLTDICGFNGAEADSLRRSIGKKDHDALMASLPKVLEGYCKVSSKPREIAEQEAKEFIQIISDSSEYQFGLNHSTGYSMIGYACVRARTYYPLEFTTAYLNRAKDEEDIQEGYKLAKTLDIQLNPVKFRYSKAEYMFNKETNSIYKGIASIKFLNESVADELYELRNNQYDSFIDLLVDIKQKTGLNSKQLNILIMIDFFSEFGRNKKLMEVTEVFNALYNKKQFKKEKVDLLGFSHDSFKANSKETEKTYGSIDWLKIVKKICKDIEDKRLSISDQITMEMELIGEIQFVLPQAPEDVYISLETKLTKYSPMVRCYNVKTGNQESLWVGDKNLWVDSPIKKLDVFKITDRTEKSIKNWYKIDI